MLEHFREHDWLVPISHAAAGPERPPPSREVASVFDI